MITHRFSRLPHGSGPHCHGFTLFELIVALGIVAILITIAVPGMRQIIDSNRLTAYINSLVSGVHLARSEAIKRNEAVDFCAGVDGCSGGDQWSSGWTVRGSDGNVVATSANQYTGLKVTAAMNTVTFDGEGLPDTELDLKLGVEGIKARRLTVSLAGGVHSGKVDE